MSGEQGVYLYTSALEQRGHYTFEDDLFTYSTVWSPDGTQAASLMKNGTVYIWSTDDGKVIDVWETRGVPSSIAWSLDGTKIAVGSGYGYGLITIYDTINHEQQEAFSGESMDFEIGPISSLVWHPNSQWLAFSTLTGAPVLVWDILNNQSVFRLLSRRSNYLVSLSPDGMFIALAGLIPGGDFAEPDQGVIYVWPIDAARPTKTVLLDEYGELDFGSLAWNPNGLLLAAYIYDLHDGENQKIKIWDTTSWELVAEYPAIHRAYDYPSYNSLAWSPDGTRLAEVGNGMI